MYDTSLIQVDHLLRKKKCDETPNWSQGYFETGLRGYYKENEKVRLRQLEKNFRNIPAKPKADGRSRMS